MPEALRNAVIPAQFAGLLGLFHQLHLEAAVGHVEHGHDHFLIGLAAQVRDPVLGDHHIAQMAGNGVVRVGEQHIGRRLAAALAPRPGHQNGARTGQFMGLADEVVLAADAAEHPTVLKLIGDRRAQQRGGERRVDETRVAALQKAQRLTAVKIVDQVHPGHIDRRPGVVVQFPQPLIEGFRAEEKAAVHNDAAVQTVTEQAFQRFPGIRVVQVVGHAVVVGQPQVAGFHHHPGAQHAEAGQPGELFRRHR